MRSTSSRKLGIEAVAGLRQRHLDLAQDAARIAAEHQDPVAHQHRLLDVVGDQNDALDGHAPFGPQVQEIGAQSLRSQHVERGERLVHEQDIRVHDQRTREAHPLAHAAGQFARIGGLETVQPDQIDGGQGALADFGSRHVLRFQPQSDVLEHREPGEQCEALEDHGDPARRSRNGLPEIAQVPGARLRQPRDQAQQSRFSRTRAAEQTDDLALAKLQIHALQHQQFLAVGLRERLAHLGALK